MLHEGEARDPSYSFGTSTVALKCVRSLNPCFNPCAPTDVAFSQRRQEYLSVMNAHSLILLRLRREGLKVAYRSIWKHNMYSKPDLRTWNYIKRVIEA